MNEAIAELAQKLGRSVEQMWPIAVRYVVTDSLVGILFYLGLASTALAVGPWLWKKLQAMPKDMDMEQTLGRVLLIGAMVVALLVSSVSIFENISRLLNPEGYLIFKVLGSK